MHKVIDNFLPKDEFTKVKDIMTSDAFPWFYTEGVGSKNDGAYFTHSLYRDFQKNSTFSNIIDSLMDRIEVYGIIRIKANLYLKTEQTIEHDYHVDYDFKHKGVLFYINTNNGYTKLSTGEKIKSIANRVLFFDPSLEHCSGTCTDENARINININYI